MMKNSKHTKDVAGEISSSIPNGGPRDLNLLWASHINPVDLGFINIP